MIETRQAALCILRRGNSFLVSEVIDPHTGAWMHRPPGGGIEDGETPEAAVRRELLEELQVGLGDVVLLGALDHVWFFKGREVHERAWLFLGDPDDDPRLGPGETPELLEADGQRLRTYWRRLDEDEPHLPPLCPASLIEYLRTHG